MKTGLTYRISIFMAGDIAVAKQACREFADSHPRCVTVRPCDYIYTGGEEAGFEIGLLHYPRFAGTQRELREIAGKLGRTLAKKCCQKSWLIVTPETTTWHERKRK